MGRRSFRLPLLLDAELERVARRNGRSPSVLIRELITDGLQRQQPPTPDQLEHEWRQEMEELEREAAHEAASPCEEVQNDDLRRLEEQEFDLQRFLQMM
jgi:predicted transcriptional regulator